MLNGVNWLDVSLSDKLSSWNWDWDVFDDVLVVNNSISDFLFSVNWSRDFSFSDNWSLDDLLFDDWLRSDSSGDDWLGNDLSFNRWCRNDFLSLLNFRSGVQNFIVISLSASLLISGQNWATSGNNSSYKILSIGIVLLRRSLNRP